MLRANAGLRILFVYVLFPTGLPVYIHGNYPGMCTMFKITRISHHSSL